MKNTDHFKGKSITIVGFARSGLACANLLYGLGAKVSVTDNRDTAGLRENLSRLKDRAIEIELGGHSRAFVEGRDIVVISPEIMAPIPCKFIHP